MSEESKPKKISSNKQFAKMRVHGKKGASPKTKSEYIPNFYKKQHGGEHPGARPVGPDGKPAFKSKGSGSSSFKRSSEGGFGKHGTSGDRPFKKDFRPRPAGSFKPREESGTEGLKKLTGDDRIKFVKRETRGDSSPDSVYSGSKRRDPAESGSPRREFRREGSTQARPDRPFKREFRRDDRGPRRDDRSASKDVVSPSRMEAAKALFSIENGAKINDMLEIKRNLIPEDEALLRELVYGCTRQKRLLDYHLNKFCATEYEKLPVEIKTALRLGLYQLLFLTRVPAHAAVFESVNLVKKAGQEPLAGFVNAVLRTLETKKTELTLEGKDAPDTLAIKYSHPTWIVKRWVSRWDAEKAEAILKANNQPHPVFLNVRPGAKEKVLAELAGQKVQMTEMEWPADTLKLKSHEGGLFSGESFQQGDWIVQDWTPQAMMALLPLAENQRAWDVCAAPGGKTVALAWRVGEKGHVTASDASAERRKRLLENIKRTALKQVLIFDHEIEKISPAQKFDLAWVDAPCSGTGVMARRADLRWKLKLEDVLAHVEQQRNLLEQAQGHLYPKGSLVYSTCSLEKEENEGIIAAFLKDHPEFRVAKLPALKGHDEVMPGDLGTMFLPTEEHDGGFLAILTRE